MFKVIGNGMVAKSFKKGNFSNINCTIFASGVSNSKCTNNELFLREENLLRREINKSLNQRYFIYFGTCSIYDKDLQNSKYVLHKINMENIVLEQPNGLIFRLPQLAGHNSSPYNFLSSIKLAADTGENFTVWEKAKRNIIDVEDVKKIVLHLITNNICENRTLNIANKNSYYVKDIIKVFEKVLQLKINTSYLKKGCSYDIDISKINFLIKEYNMETIEYIEKLAEKYYKN